MQSNSKTYIKSFNTKKHLSIHNGFNPLLRKIQRNIEDYGALIALKKGFTYILKPVYENRIYRIYSIDLKGYTIPKILKSDLQFKFIDNSDQRIIQQIEEAEEWLRGEIPLKLAVKQAICLVALDGEKLAGFNLVLFGKIYIPLIRMKRNLESDEAWSGQITVNKHYRSQGLGIELRYRIFDELKKKGVQKFHGGTLANNKASLNLARRTGFKNVEDVHYLRFLNFERRRHIEIKDN